MSRNRARRAAQLLDVPHPGRCAPPTSITSITSLSRSCQGVRLIRQVPHWTRRPSVATIAGQGGTDSTSGDLLTISCSCLATWLVVSSVLPGGLAMA